MIRDFEASIYISFLSLCLDVPEDFVGGDDAVAVGVQQAHQERQETRVPVDLVGQGVGRHVSPSHERDRRVVARRNRHFPLGEPAATPLPEPARRGEQGRLEPAPIYPVFGRLAEKVARGEGRRGLGDGDEGGEDGQEGGRDHCEECEWRGWRRGRGGAAEAEERGREGGHLWRDDSALIDWRDGEEFNFESLFL